MSIIGFRKILDLIFTCNIFKYDKIFFLQLIGLPMGCVCGPSVANLYVYILEKEWLVIHNNELIYFRFIDDSSSSSSSNSSTISLGNFPNIFS